MMNCVDEFAHYMYRTLSTGSHKTTFVTVITNKLRSHIKKKNYQYVEFLFPGKQQNDRKFTASITGSYQIGAVSKRSM